MFVCDVISLLKLMFQNGKKISLDEDELVLLLFFQLCVLFKRFGPFVYVMY